ncbi:MAG: AAA family ATPase [Candidatus Moraniibacteriota bacterium]|nr:MAG: AAA family ATPase [Candidatus Moranbacteria bacterium]
MPKILVLGPSGSGKTYISAALREKGINALDGDLIENLSDWFDGTGNKVGCPPDANKEFLDTHEFLWDREVLKDFLKQQDSVYLFGMSGNAFDMVDLFDKTYFLKATPEILANRLRHESRENPMGKTDYQLQNALDWAKEIEQEASSRGIATLDANKSPEEIFDEIV